MADTLCCSPCTATADTTDLEKLAEMAATAAVAQLPASTERLDHYRRTQEDNATCLLLKEYCLTGWPEQSSVDPVAKPYWEKRGELTVCEKLLLCGNCIVVPLALQEETLSKLHQGHQGIQRCRLRAQTLVWWPGISKKISKMIKKCPVCSRDATPNRESLLPTSLPDHPWQMLGSDLIKLNCSSYLLVVDYCSRYPEIVQR